MIVENVKLDTKVTILGHVQRGGTPSAFDRILASRMGADAIMCLMDATKDSLPQIICLDGNSITRMPMMEAVNKTRSIKTLMDARDFENAVITRGTNFQINLNSYLLMAKVNPPQLYDQTEKAKHFVMAVMCLGSPSSGMNAAIRTFVRYTVNNGYSVYALHHGFEGLMQNHVDMIRWEDVNGWSSDAGTNVGASSVLIDQFGVDKVAAQMRKYKIAALLIIGGFEAFYSALVMAEMRHRYLEFCIPITVIPASASNNLPGTDISVGSDTALNEIMSMCDKMRQSAIGSKNRVYICETLGNRCGYLTTMGALAAGADASYIFEEAYGIRELMTDLVHLAIKIRNGISRGLILKSDESNEMYNMDFLYRLYSQEGRSSFSTKSIALGVLQEGGTPTPFDRLLGTKLASMCAEQLITQLNDCVSPTGVVNTLSPETCSMIGLQKRQIAFTSIQDLKKQFNFQHRIPRDNWWIKLRTLSRILATHDSVYWFETSEKSKEEEKPKAAT